MRLAALAFVCVLSSAQTKIPATQLEQTESVVSLAEVRLLGLAGSRLVQILLGPGVTLDVTAEGKVRVSGQDQPVVLGVKCKRIVTAAATYWQPATAPKRQVVVYRNGLRQLAATDYTLQDGKIVPVEPWEENDLVLIDDLP